MDEPTLRLLRRLRASRAVWGSVCGFVVDGETELYTQGAGARIWRSPRICRSGPARQAARGGAGSLYNQHILAARRELGGDIPCTHGELGERLLAFSPKRVGRPKLLVLHASESGRSSTLWMGRELSRRLSGCSIAEISLRNGTIHDCRGCSYSACLHFARSGSCTRRSHLRTPSCPRSARCDAMLFLCPNYNDAVGANFTALFNRLTSLLLQCDLSEKQLYSVIVSAYSGGDLRRAPAARCDVPEQDRLAAAALLPAGNGERPANGAGSAGHRRAAGRLAAAMQRSCVSPPGTAQNHRTNSPISSQRVSRLSRMAAFVCEVLCSSTTAPLMDARDELGMACSDVG